MYVWHFGGVCSGTEELFSNHGYAGSFSLSSSGGGLPGRPVTRMSRDACLFWPEFLALELAHEFSLRQDMALDSLLKLPLAGAGA